MMAEVRLYNPKFAGKRVTLPAPDAQGESAPELAVTVEFDDDGFGPVMDSVDVATVKNAEGYSIVPLVGDAKTVPAPATFAVVEPEPEPEVEDVPEPEVEDVPEVVERPVPKITVPARARGRV